MQILRSIPELARLPGPLFLAIGVFDGIHRGHQAVISTSAEHARSANGTPVVVTFDPHPVKVLRPGQAPHLLTATQHKIRLIRDLGVQHLLIIKFDKAFAATLPEDFVQQLVTHSKPLREICVGHEWSFGKGRRGNLALLGKLGAQFDFEVVGIPPVTLGKEELVSSTAIRHAIEAGDFAKAAEMLGREYTILGTVVGGEHLGKKIGFPTANLSAHSEQFPPNGVYFAEAKLDGVIYPGVVNLGYRPTVSSDKAERVLEIHLLDFERDIYGKDIEVRFVQYLRPEQKFENLDALVRQIELDVQQARKLSAGL
jgi:riboflavin kinase / FMN adenylyltransferase